MSVDSLRENLCRLLEDFLKAPEKIVSESFEASEFASVQRFFQILEISNGDRGRRLNDELNSIVQNWGGNTPPKKVGAWSATKKIIQEKPQTENEIDTGPAAKIQKRGISSFAKGSAATAKAQQKMERRQTKADILRDLKNTVQNLKEEDLQNRNNENFSFVDVLARARQHPRGSEIWARAILGVGDTVTLGQARRAFLVRAREWHPDLLGIASEDAMACLNESWSIIKISLGNKDAHPC